MTFRGRAEHQPTEKGSANWSARVLERESRELATPTIMFPQRARVAVSLDCKYFRWSTGVFVQQEIREHLGSGRTKIIGITVLVLGLVLLGLFVLDSNSPGTTGLLHGDGSSSPVRPRLHHLPRRTHQLPRSHSSEIPTPPELARHPDIRGRSFSR